MRPKPYRHCTEVRAQAGPRFRIGRRSCASTDAAITAWVRAEALGFPIPGVKSPYTPSQMRVRLRMRIGLEGKVLTPASAASGAMHASR